MIGRGSPGFTLLELIVVLALAGVVAASVHHALTSQRRFYRDQRAIATRHDALRLAGSLIASDVRAASPGDGDLAALSGDSLSLRAPVGFGVVCAVDTTSAAIGLFDVHGRIAVTAGDSMLLYTPGGWLVRAALEIDPSDVSLACAYAGVPLETTVRVTGSVAGVPVGAPVQAFRQRAYHLEQDAGRWWLAWSGDTAAEILAGPFASDGSGVAFAYLDSLGTAAASPAGVARVDITMIAEAEVGPARPETLRASAGPRNR